MPCKRNCFGVFVKNTYEIQSRTRNLGIAEEGIAISIITYLEAFQGVVRSPHPEEAQGKFQAFAESVLILYLLQWPSAVLA
jgi:predicted nucleic acid-binding protein